MGAFVKCSKCGELTKQETIAGKITTNCKTCEQNTQIINKSQN